MKFEKLPDFGKFCAGSKLPDFWVSNRIDISESGDRHFLRYRKKVRERKRQGKKVIETAREKGYRNGKGKGKGKGKETAREKGYRNGKGKGKGKGKETAKVMYRTGKSRCTVTHTAAKEC